MMKNTLLGLTLVCLALAGCTGEGDSGDVKRAEEAAARAPKSVDQLPQDMPPQAKAQAGAAMGQMKAMQEMQARENEARRRAGMGK